MDNKAHADAQSYRNKALTNFDDMCLLYAHATADGRYSFSSHDVDFDDDIQTINVGEEKRSDSFAGDGHNTHNEEEIFSDVNNEFPCIEWTASMERCLIDIMVEQKDTTSKIDTADLVPPFKYKFGLYYDKGILGSHCKRLERQYIDMKNLLSRGGFWWDEKQLMVKASDDVWDSYLAENPGAESYRTIPKPNYNDLCLIYGKSTANELGGQSISCNGSDWKPDMDRFFIDLMLEQVRNGSMLNQKFSELAWTDMAAKFSAEFGPQHDKEVLRSRFWNLRKRFFNMKALVDRTGFAWDEMQQKITADDDLWDTCAQEDLDEISYRNRSLPNLNDLYLIFGDENAIKKQRYSSSSMDSEDSGSELNIGEEDDQSPIDMYLSIPTGSRDAIQYEDELLDCCDDLFASFGYEFASESSNMCFDTKPDLNNRQNIETSDVFCDLRSPAREFQLPDQRKKRKPTGSSKPVSSGKAQRPIKEETGRCSIERVVGALQSVPGLSEEGVLEACKLLEDERKAEMFVAMDFAAREKWLLRRLRYL